MRGSDGRGGPGRRHHPRPGRAMGDVAAGGAGTDGRSASSAAPPPPRGADAPPRGRRRRPRGPTSGPSRGEAVGPGHLPADRGGLRRGRRRSRADGDARARPSRSRPRSIARRFCLPPSCSRFAHVGSGPLREGGGTARFTLDWIGLDACPIRLDRLQVRRRAGAPRPRSGGSPPRARTPTSRRSVASAFATVGGTVRLAAAAAVAPGAPGSTRRGGNVVARRVPVQSRGVSPVGIGYPGRGSSGSACGFRDQMTSARA